jgi:hypothetical protein
MSKKNERIIDGEYERMDALLDRVVHRGEFIASCASRRLLEDFEEERKLRNARRSRSSFPPGHFQGYFDFILFEDFAEALNTHPKRNMLLTEIVAMWIMTELPDIKPCAEVWRPSYPLVVR